MTSYSSEESERNGVNTGEMIKKLKNKLENHDDEEITRVIDVFTQYYMMKDDCTTFKTSISLFEKLTEKLLQDILYCKSTDLRFCNVIEKKHKSFALVQELYHSKIVPEIDTRSVEDYTVEIQRQEKEIIAVEEAIQNRINDLQSLARQYDETEDELKQEYQKYSRLLGEYNNKLEELKKSEAEDTLLLESKTKVLEKCIAEKERREMELKAKEEKERKKKEADKKRREAEKKRKEAEEERKKKELEKKQKEMEKKQEEEEEKKVEKKETIVESKNTEPEVKKAKRNSSRNSKNVKPRYKFEDESDLDANDQSFWDF